MSHVARHARAKNATTGKVHRKGLPMVGDVQNLEKDGFYATPHWVTQALLRSHDFLAGPVWEPATGEGHIADVLDQHRRATIRTDLVERGGGAETPVDFLLERRARAPVIITNPPYQLTREFVDHALNIGVEQIAFLLKLSFAQGAARSPWLFRETPLAKVLIVPKRIAFLNAREKVQNTTSFMDPYAWFVWEKWHVGAAILTMTN